MPSVGPDAARDGSAVDHLCGLVTRHAEHLRDLGRRHPIAIIGLYLLFLCHDRKIIDIIEGFK